MNRANRLKFILWAILGVAAPVAAARFLLGMGATTNLSDTTPWGIWIGFDVMGKVLKALEPFGEAESPPKLIGRSIIMSFNSK